MKRQFQQLTLLALTLPLRPDYISSMGASVEGEGAWSTPVVDVQKISWCPYVPVSPRHSQPTTFDHTPVETTASPELIAQQQPHQRLSTGSPPPQPVSQPVSPSSPSQSAPQPVSLPSLFLFTSQPASSPSSPQPRLSNRRNTIHPTPLSLPAEGAPAFRAGGIRRTIVLPGWTSERNRCYIPF